MDSIQTRTLHSNYNSIAHYAPVDISTYITENYGGNFETMLSKSVDGYLTDEKLSSLLKSALSGADHTSSTGIVRIVSGSGSPNGSISASVGTFYQDTNPRGSLWFKNSGGATNVGWSVIPTPKGGVPQGSDVHSLDIGLWTTASSSQTKSLLNIPKEPDAQTIAFIEVLPIFDGKKLIRWTTYNPGGLVKSWVKWEIYSGWTEWSTLSGLSSEPKILKTGDDLNNVTVPGEYAVFNKTVLNIPVEREGFLRVYSVGIAIMQEYTDSSYTPKTYVRRITPSSSTYGQWRELGSSETYKVLSDSSDLNNVVGQGFYSVPSTSTLNIPEKYAGILEVISVGIAVIQRYTSATYTPKTYVRRITPSSSTYGEWIEISSSSSNSSGILSVGSGADLNDVSEPGVYTVIPNDVTNRPIKANGILEVLALGIARIQRYTTTFGYEPRVFIRRTTPQSSLYGDWFEVGDNESVDAQYVKSHGYKKMLLEKLSATKGGVIGTGGKAVVSLRFDDSATVFRDTVAKMLFDRGLPFTRVTTTERLSYVPNDMDSFESIQEYTIKYGGEVWNHGMTHLNVSGDNKKKGFETVGALEKLSKNMPKLLVCNYAPPGGNITYDGDFPLDSITKLTENYSGKVISTNHAIASGYIPGTLYKVLDGTPRDGQRHFSADNFTLSRIKSTVEQAIKTGTGIVLMYHPANFGGSGFISLDEFGKILDYFVELRDSDKIMVLTKSGLSFANIQYPIRHNLIRTNEFISTDSALTINYVADTEGIQGSSREMVFKSTLQVDSVTTTVEFVGSGIVSSKTHTVTGTDKVLRHCFTVPTDCTSIKITTSSPINSVNIYST